MALGPRLVRYVVTVQTGADLNSSSHSLSRIRAALDTAVAATADPGGAGNLSVYTAGGLGSEIWQVGTQGN